MRKHKTFFRIRPSVLLGLLMVVIAADNLSTANACDGTIYNLTLNIYGSGRVSINGTYYSSSTVKSFAAGTTIEAIASANSGNMFDYWSGALSGSSTSGTFTMSSARTLDAYFVPAYTLTTSVSPSGAGSVSPPGTTTHASGSSVTVRATGNAGYVFDHWSGDLSGSTSPTNITMNSNKSVTAVFVTGYTLTTTASPSAGGAIDPAGTTTYISNTLVDVEATASTGFRFDHWSGSLSGSTNPTTITMTSNKSVTANFVQTYTLTTAASPSQAGTLDPSGTHRYDSGTSVTVTATAKTGYRFDHWSGALSGSTNPATVTMDANKSVTAVFIRRYTLTTEASPSDGGTVTPPGTNPYDSGTSVTVAATASSGYRFHHWSGDLSGSTNPSTVTMDADKSVTAVFVKTYTLTTSTTGSGSVTLSPSGGTYDIGTSVQLTPVPAACWRFDRWEGDLTGSANPASITMDANKSVTAVFIQHFTLSAAATPSQWGTIQPRSIIIAVLLYMTAVRM